MITQTRKLCMTMLLIVTIAALIGCQAVQGLEIGQVMINSLTVQSGQSKGELRLQLIPGSANDLTAKEQAMLDVLRDVTINIKSARMQDLEHLSAEAELSYKNGKIPFQLFIAGDEIVLDMEGAKKPIVFKPGKGSEAADGGSLTRKMDELLEKKLNELAPVISSYLVAHAPNPNTIDVSPSSEQVNGETLSLHKIHVEINGSELTGLLKVFLRQILQDEEGLKELLAQLYDAFMPIIKANIEQLEAQSGLPLPDSGAAGGMFNVQELAMAYLDNKTLMVEFAYTTLHHFLEKAVKELEQSTAASSSHSGSDSLQLLLSEKAVLQADFFVDSDKQIRKQQMDVYIPLGPDTDQIAALRVTSTMEMWDLNKPTAAAKAERTDDALVIDGARSMDAQRFVHNFTEDSQMYKLLKQELQITKKEIRLLLDEASEHPYDASHPYINENGVAMVPARFLAEQLGAEVEWYEEDQEIEVYDEVSDTWISLTIGSTAASVNDTQVTLESAAVMKNGSAYVPLRFMVEALGGKLAWDEQTRTVTITRE